MSGRSAKQSPRPGGVRRLEQHGVGLRDLLEKATQRLADQLRWSSTTRIFIGKTLARCEVYIGSEDASMKTRSAANLRPAVLQDDSRRRG